LNEISITIHEASLRSHVSAKMIRHYEAIGLIAPPERGENRYRHYSARLIHELSFIRQARLLGFSIHDIRRLLALWRDKTRASAEVKAIALAHIRDLDAKAAALRAMSESLRDLAEKCQGDHRPDCPILDELALCAPHDA
jgi:MerR family copper efflux transcriptional regulator